MEKVLWRVLTTLAAIATGVATRRLIAAAWGAVAGGDPPRNPAEREVGWSDALAWAVAAGVAVSVARVVARRGAVSAWESATGDLPPGIGD